MNTATIEQVQARQIFDSRGRPTVEVDVLLTGGQTGRACAPSGASTGRHEAFELRDGNAGSYGGLGVGRAVGHVNGEICAALKGMPANDQSAVDHTLTALDGTPQLARLGGNAVIATSLAVCRAAALHAQMPLHRYINTLTPGRPMTLPMPMVNILSGGAHARNGMDLQDLLAVPLSATSYSQALAMVLAVRASAAELMVQRGLSSLLADEGGLSPGFKDPREALELMVAAFKAARFEPGRDMGIAIDVAASELLNDGAYRLACQQLVLDGPGMSGFLGDILSGYPVVSIEDPLDQDDWAHWQTFTTRFGHCQVVGDDLFVTSAERISRGIDEKVANAALIKVNQNGTLSGTLQAMRMAWSAGYATVVSARSGETDDSFIADLAVGTGAGQIKIGSVRNSERLAKYNQLLRIEAMDAMPFSGRAALAGRLPRRP